MSQVRLMATVDQIEGERAVLLLQVADDEILVHWPVSLLPSGVGEGSKIEFTLRKDRDAEAEARQRVADLLEKLTRRDEGQE